jgi:hypothetical protein
MQQAIQQSSGLNLNPKQFQDSTWLSAAASFVASGKMPVTPPYGPDCSGQGAPNVNIFQTASGLALGTTSAAVGMLGPSGAALIPAAAVPVIGWAIAGVSALIGIISAIFQHHAMAVKRDLQFGCSALPAVNNAFAVIAQAVQNGQTTPADAAASLDQIYSEYQAAGGAAINTSPWCNSNCELGVILKAMVLYWKAQYAAMPAPASSSGTSVISADISSAMAKLPSWVPLAAAVGFGLWAFDVL